MRARRLAGGAVVAAVTMFGIGALTRVPFTEHRADDAQVRLAWKFRSDRVRACRTLTPEELAKLPRHMRTAQVCEGALRPYVVELAVDGATLLVDTVRAAGATSDRPLFVFREAALAPGRHALQVRFTPVSVSGGDAHDDDTRAPRPLALDTTVTLGVRDVGLVTLDEAGGTLIVKQHP